MSDGLAKDLAAAKTNDVLTLAPHAGTQTVVSAEELAPEARAKLRSSTRSSRMVARHVATPAATPVAEVASASTDLSPLPMATASAPDPGAAGTPVPEAAPQPVIASVPEPVAASSPDDDAGSARGGRGGIGGILGAIGGAILRGGVVGDDHCDPRGRHGGGILINRRGPIIRGSF